MISATKEPNSWRGLQTMTEHSRISSGRWRSKPMEIKRLKELHDTAVASRQNGPQSGANRTEPRCHVLTQNSSQRKPTYSSFKQKPTHSTSSATRGEARGSFGSKSGRIDPKLAREREQALDQQQGEIAKQQDCWTTTATSVN